MTLTEFLIAQSLDVLNIVWSKGSERLQTIVSDRIQKVCEFNLPEDWESLNEEQLKSLHRFEDGQQAWLLNQIFVDQESSGTSTETKYTTSNNRSAVLIFWFGVILTIASLSYIAAITWIPIPPDNIRFADTSLGFVLGTLLATVINFFFGSSMQKTDFHLIPTSLGTARTQNSLRSVMMLTLLLVLCAVTILHLLVVLVVMTPTHLKKVACTYHLVHVVLVVDDMTRSLLHLRDPSIEDVYRTNYIDVLHTGTHWSLSSSEYFKCGCDSFRVER